MKKALRVTWFYTREGFSHMFLFAIYMTMRILKTPLWNLEIDPYMSWFWFDDQRLRDTAIVTFLALGVTGFIFLSWWLFIIAFGFIVLNYTVLFVWMWRRSRKNGTNTGEELSILKSNAISKIKKK